MNVKQFVGTDEAGYGPNLGPLAIACSCWEVSTDSDFDSDFDCDLYRQLAPLVTCKGVVSGDTADRIEIADSKQVFRSGKLERLEQNVLAIIGSMSGGIPTNGFEMLRRLLPGPDYKAIAQTFWLSPFLANDGEFLDESQGKGHSGGLSLRHGSKLQGTKPFKAPPFPLESNREVVKRLADRFCHQCESNGVKLIDIRCRLILPAAFNLLLDQGSNKAELLSHGTLALVQQVLEPFPLSAIEIQCDKHGGRSHYAGLIQHFFGDRLVSVETETRSISRYHFRRGGHPATISFSARGESFLPIALSSMVAKYLREYLMRLWNLYWQSHLPAIKPTQGYPVDAQRFLSDIGELLKSMNIPPDTIWRRK